VAAVREHYRNTHSIIDIDGVRVAFGDGWGLLRASNTQPVLVLRFEAATQERLAAIRKEMESVLKNVLKSIF
jgi:phosphomannomutase/phosphoglucomutase